MSLRSARRQRPWRPMRALVGWSASAALAPLPPSATQYFLNFEGVPASGVDVQLTLRGAQPVEIEALGVDAASASGAEMDALRRRLPDWVTLNSYSYRRVRLKV